MKMSANAIAMLDAFESVELEAYPDPGSELGLACTRSGLRMSQYRNVTGGQKRNGAPWTIGRGHTGSEVKPGLVWTMEQVEAAFAKDIASFERDVLSLCKLPPTQNEFDALVSFAYNVGSDIDIDDVPEGLGDSSLLRFYNAGKKALAADQFPKWNKSKGKVLRGLTRRRNAERAMFLGQDWKKANI